jgi:hypothetical protein
MPWRSATVYPVFPLWFALFGSRLQYIGSNPPTEGDFGQSDLSSPAAAED